MIFIQINHVFEHIRILSDHTGPVLFVEEDHYVAPDFIHTLLVMTRVQVT